MTIDDALARFLVQLEVGGHSPAHLAELSIASDVAKFCSMLPTSSMDSRVPLLLLGSMAP